MLRAPDPTPGLLHAPRRAVASLSGTTLDGTYEVGDLLGEGSTGRVYRAVQTALSKPVAIKVLHAHLAGNERVATRFLREARAASRLAHPNSLQVLDVGTAPDGTRYLVMELLEGEDLQTVIDHDAPFSPARIAALLVPVLRAVEEAHRAGIIHRDLKPENLVVQHDRSGREHVKVCDFGIAKVLDGDDGTSITVDGFVCGTPEYMAPEQGRGDPIDHRSDLYALGVVLYQMLVGDVPFRGESALGTITRHVTERVVPPRERRPELGIPWTLEAVCLRALSKRPGDRHRSAEAMAEALEEAVRGLGDAAANRLGEPPFVADAPHARIETSAEERSTATTPSTTPPTVATRRGLAPTTLGVVVAVLAVSLAIAAWPRETAPAPVPRRAPGLRVAPSADPAATPEAPRQDVPGTEPLVVDASVVPRADGPTPGDMSRPSTRPRAARARGSAEVDPAPATAPAEARPRAAPSPADAPSLPAASPFDEGRRLFLANDVAGAIRQFERAAESMPRNAEVHRQLGRAYMRAGDTARSVASYRRYLALAPDAPDRLVVERLLEQHASP